MSVDRQSSNGGSMYGGSGNPPRREPMFNLPTVVTVFLIIMWLLQIGRDTFLSQQQNIWLIIQGGFIPLRYGVSSPELGLAWLWTPVAYSFLHGGYGHLIVNSVWLMAFGAIVARRSEPPYLLRSG